MRSAMFGLMLLCALGVGHSSFAQGRGGGGSGGGRGGGTPNMPTRPEPAVSRPAPEPDRGKGASDGTSNADPRSAKANDAAGQLAGNPGLSAQVAKLFPDGTDLGVMAGGFRNLGAFVSAAHVSRNLGIPFDQLKTKIVRDGSSLGDAIHSIKPELGESGAKAEARKAEERAKKDLK